MLGFSTASNLIHSALKFENFSPWNILRVIRQLPLQVITTTVCYGVVIMLCSKYIVLQARDFMKWKVKWRIQSRITALKACEGDVTSMIRASNCNPIMLRLAWSDAGTYDRNISVWPLCGGCNGSIRMENENQQIVNKGLDKAIALLLPIKRKYTSVSWADLIQMAGANAVRLTGGPAIPLKYGRVDIPKKYFPDEKLNLEFCIAQSKKLPCNSFPYPDGSHTPEFHIRNVFFRLGFSSREIVALCGGHTIGRGFRDRSGVCPFSSGDRGATQFTRLTSLAKGNGEVGIGMAGGMSWTENWLQFDNSYFKRPYKSRSKEQRKREKEKEREGSEECKDAVVKDRTESLSSAGTACQSDSPSRQRVRRGQGQEEENSSSSSSFRAPSTPIMAGKHGHGHGQRGSNSNDMDTSCSSSNSNSNCSASSPSPSPFPSPSTSRTLCPGSSSSSSELLWLPTDEALFKAPEFKFYFEQYAKDQNLFFADYSSAHRKMTELGAKFDPPEGIEFS